MPNATMLQNGILISAVERIAVLAIRNSSCWYNTSSDFMFIFKLL